jgi:hypothetical protein
VKQLYRSTEFAHARVWFKLRLRLPSTPFSIPEKAERIVQLFSERA